MDPKTKTKPKPGQTKPKELWQAAANREAYRVKKYKPKPGHMKVKK